MIVVAKFHLFCNAFTDYTYKGFTDTDHGFHTSLGGLLRNSATRFKPIKVCAGVCLLTTKQRYYTSASIDAFFWARRSQSHLHSAVRTSITQTSCIGSQIEQRVQFISDHGFKIHDW